MSLLLEEWIKGIKVPTFVNIDYKNIWIWWIDNYTYIRYIDLFIKFYQEKIMIYQMNV